MKYLIGLQPGEAQQGLQVLYVEGVAYIYGVSNKTTLRRKLATWDDNIFPSTGQLCLYCETSTLQHAIIFNNFSNVVNLHNMTTLHHALRYFLYEMNRWPYKRESLKHQL